MRRSIALWSMNSVGQGAFGPVHTYHQMSSPSFCRSAQIVGSWFGSIGHHRSTAPNSGSMGSSVSIRRIPGAASLISCMPSRTKS